MPPKVKPLANRSRIAVPSFYLRISSAPRNVGSFPRLVSKCRSWTPHLFRRVELEEDVMKTITFMFGASALLISLGTAAAGPCTTEIESLTKFMAARDAGAGPTAGAASTTSGQATRQRNLAIPPLRSIRRPLP